MAEKTDRLEGGKGKWQRPLSEAEAQAHVAERLQHFGHYIALNTPHGWGFVVLCFPFGAGGRMNYIANCQRAQVVRAMYEFIEATKEKWGEHAPAEAEPGTQMGDELVGRLRQQIAALERENEGLRNNL